MSLKQSPEADLANTFGHNSDVTLTDVGKVEHAARSP